MQVKENNPSYSICDVAKELGRRWAEMDKATKDRYQARAEEERQKYDVEMAAYRQSNLNSQNATGTTIVGGTVVASGSVTGGVTVVSTVSGQQVVVSQPVQSVNASLSSPQQQAVSYATIQHQPTVTKVEAGGGSTERYSNLLQ